MALFGAPVAHEDHALRACYAGLAMQVVMRRYAEEVRCSHGLEVQMHVGLNSGEVVVCAIGNDLHMDYSAVGQTTPLAAHMEQFATSGSIRLTAATFRMAEGLLQVNALGQFSVKLDPALQDALPALLARLAPLPPVSADEFLQVLLGDAPSLKPLIPLLITRTEGNPFFLEESVHTLVETGVLVGEPSAYCLAQAMPTVQVPTTVQAVLAARIDRLPAEEKRLLQTAAVIGTEVPLALQRGLPFANGRPASPCAEPWPKRRAKESPLSLSLHCRIWVF